MKFRFARFTMVGLLGAAVQMILLTFFSKCFRLPAVWATALAVELTLCHNFLWHERFTWAEHSPHNPLRRLCRFQLTNGLVSLFGNTVLSYFLVQRLHAPLLPSALVSIALCSLANFALAHRWVYSQTRQLKITLPELPERITSKPFSNW